MSEDGVREGDERRESSAPRRGIGVVHAALLAPIVEDLERAGVPRDGLLAELDVDPAVLTRADAFVPLAVIRTLWERAPALAKDPDYGIHAAERIGADRHFIMSYASRCAKTVGEAIAEGARMYARITELTIVRFEDDGPRGIRLVQEISLPDRQLRHAWESLFVIIMRSVAQWSGQPVRPTRVAFVHTRPRSTREHERVFGRVPAFDAPFNEIEFDRATADIPLATSDDRMSAVLREYAEEHLGPTGGVSTADRVRAVLRRGMGKREMTLEDVAHALTTSGRTLQRRLEADGMSFAELQDDVRKGLALAYLADPSLSIKEIAARLGFSDTSGLARAARRWTGKGLRALRGATTKRC